MKKIRRAQNLARELKDRSGYAVAEQIETILQEVLDELEEGGYEDETPGD